MEKLSLGCCPLGFSWEQAHEGERALVLEVFLPHVGLPIGVGRVDISTILSAGSAIELGAGLDAPRLAGAGLCALRPVGCL